MVRLVSVIAVLLLAAGCASAPRENAVEQGSPAPTSVSVSDSASAARSTPSAPPSTTSRNSINPQAAPAKVLRRVGDVPILCYHQIRPWTPSDSAQARAYIMPPETFRAQMEYLDEHGYHPITPDQLLAHLTTGAELPPKPVLLTFDDADDTHFTTVLPVLKQHGFTATFFIMTVVLGSEGYMTKDQLRKLEAAGMTIALHTWDHHRVDRYSAADWQKQLVEPTETLESIVGHRIRYFAYPYGVWDEQAFGHLREQGYWAAFQLSTAPVDEQAPLYTLQRMIANPYWSIEEFAAHLKQ